MTATGVDIICIHQGEDGAVCGQPEDGRYDATGGALLDIHPGLHPYVPGRKCPTCDGSGEIVTTYFNTDRVMWSDPCPTCAASPARGYLEVKA